MSFSFIAPLVQAESEEIKNTYVIHQISELHLLYLMVLTVISLFLVGHRQLNSGSISYLKTLNPLKSTAPLPCEPVWIGLAETGLSMLMSPLWGVE